MLGVILVAAAVAIWAWKDGQGRALRFGDVAAAVAALTGINAIRHGQAAIGAVALLGALAWLLLRRRASDPAMGVAEARRVLDLPAGADAAEVRAAHRRLIARNHPDIGGSADLARRVNVARDTLLAAMNRTRG